MAAGIVGLTRIAGQSRARLPIGNPSSAAFDDEMVVLLASATAISRGNDRGAFAFAAPKGVTATDVFNLIAPGEDQHLATLTGLQKWPYRENTYVGIVCLASDKRHYDEDMRYCNGSSCCRAGYGGFNEAKNPRRVFIGVVESSGRLRSTSWR
jgi:hypothetical protein